MRVLVAAGYPVGRVLQAFAKARDIETEVWAVPRSHGLRQLFEDPGRLGDIAHSTEARDAGVLPQLAGLTDDRVFLGQRVPVGHDAVELGSRKARGRFDQRRILRNSRRRWQTPSELLEQTGGGVTLDKFRLARERLLECTACCFAVTRLSERRATVVMHARRVRAALHRLIE